MSGVENFIESSSKLLQASPSCTLSVTYSNLLKKSNKKPDKDGKLATNVVKFKCYEPKSGRVVKYSTSKAKELSRLMIFIGPRGVSVNNASSTNSSNTEHRNGLASLMCNTKFEEPVNNAVSAAISASNEVVGDTTPSDTRENTPVSSAGASKNKKKSKKKKGKK